MSGAGFMVAALHLKEDGAEEQLGSMRLGAGSAIGGVEGIEVEACDGVFDGAGEVVGRHALFQLAACGVVVVPGRGAKTGPWIVRGVQLG